MDARDTGSSAPILVMAIGGTILGIEPATGEVAWTYPLASAQEPAALLVTETRIFCCSTPRLACLEYPTGQELWTASVANGVGPCLSLVDGRLFVTSFRGELECFTVDGQPLWHNKLKGKGTGGGVLGVPGRVASGQYWR
jgi:outer membrane protein assembly factor BamB